MAFIRKVKTASGATAVQITHKRYGRIVGIDHIGSAHTEADLETLLALAKKRLVGGQQSLFQETISLSPLKINLRRSVSDVLFKVLTEQYNQLGFNQLEDAFLLTFVLPALLNQLQNLIVYGFWKSSV